jgi:hypothetical protein
VWPRHLAPDDADLGAAHLLLTPVDVRDLLTGIEVGSGGVIDALDLDQAGLGVGRVAATLITQVATPMRQSRSVSRVHRQSEVSGGLSRVAWVHRVRSRSWALSGWSPGFALT